MQIPVQITVRGMSTSPAVEEAIRNRIAKLERFSEWITSCHVLVEAPHHHQHQGGHYRIRIDLGLPGDLIVADRSPDEHAAHEDIYVAIRDSFRAARRRLDAHIRRMRGEVKTHATPDRSDVDGASPP